MSTPQLDTPDAEVSTSEALLVEPSRLSPTRRAVTTVLRSRELSIFLVLVAVVPAFFLPRKRETSALLDDEDAGAAPIMMH